MPYLVYVDFQGSVCQNYKMKHNPINWGELIREAKSRITRHEVVELEEILEVRCHAISSEAFEDLMVNELTAY